MNNRGETKRILEFEGLRGLLSWWVVVDHLLLSCGFSTESLPPGIRLITHGDYAVDVFIILSGFVIFKLLADAREPYRVFLTRRFFRLYPVFIITLVFAIIQRPLIWSNLSHWNENPVVAVGRGNWINDGTHFQGYLVSHLLLLHGVVPDFLLPHSAFALLAPAWSVSLEWQFYLVVPFFFRFLCRRGLDAWVVTGICLMMGVWLLYAPLASQYPMNAFLPQRMVYFWIGIISFHFWQRYGGSGVSGSFLMVLSPLVLFFTLSIPLALWTAVVAMAMRPGGLLSQWSAAFFCSPIMQKLGRVSYSTYLAHMCCIWLVQWLLFRVFPAASPLQMLCLLFPASVPMIYFVSCLMHRYIEVPGMRLGRRLTS